MPQANFESKKNPQLLISNNEKNLKGVYKIETNENQIMNSENSKNKFTFNANNQLKYEILNKNVKPSENDRTKSRGPMPKK